MEEKVRDLNHLANLVQQRKSITIRDIPAPGWSGRLGYVPAAWAFNWPGSVIHRFLPKMFVYRSKKDAKGAEGQKEIITDSKENGDPHRVA